MAEDTLYLQLHKLSAVKSEQILDQILTTLWKTRRSGLRPPDKSRFQSLLSLPSLPDLDPVIFLPFFSFVLSLQPNMLLSFIYLFILAWLFCFSVGFVWSVKPWNMEVKVIKRNPHFKFVCYFCYYYYYYYLLLYLNIHFTFNFLLLIFFFFFFVFLFEKRSNNLA